MDLLKDQATFVYALEKLCGWCSLVAGKDTNFYFT